MLNILGDSWYEQDAEHAQEPAWQQVLAIPGVSLHLYGKTEARKGRKMGHVNIVHTDPEQLVQHARQVSQILHLNAQV